MRLIALVLLALGSGLAGPTRSCAQDRLTAGARAATHVLEQLESGTRRVRSAIEALPEGARREGLRRSLERLLDLEGEGEPGAPSFAFFQEGSRVAVVQCAASLDPRLVASQLHDRLAALERAFDRSLGGLAESCTVLRTSVVVLLAGERAYELYRLGRSLQPDPLQSAHFEPDTGYLIAQRDTGQSTLFHEALHQMLWARRRVRSADHALPLWFEEGLAEWWGHVARAVDTGTGAWNFEPGVVPGDRLVAWRGAVSRLGRRLSLRELLDATVGTRNTWMQEGGEGRARLQLAYAQGWMLIHFLHHFDLDAEGLHIIPRGSPLEPRGRHAAGWRRYLRLQLIGREGQPHQVREAFMEALKIDGEGLDLMARHFRGYQDWILRKVSMRALVKGRIVGWKHHLNRRGEQVGRPDDDRLGPPEER